MRIIKWNIKKLNKLKMKENCNLEPRISSKGYKNKKEFFKKYIAALVSNKYFVVL